MEMVKANAPCCKVEAVDDSNCVIARDTLLAMRSPSLQKNLLAPPGLEEPRLEVLGAPPGLELPQPLAPLACDTSTTCAETDIDSSDIDSLRPTEPEEEEYRVLLQNLPKAVLKEAALRAMVKEAKLKDIKKLAFKSDGRALITVTTLSALFQCIEHFHGLPWFNAPTCTVPTVTATYVQTATSRKSLAGKGNPQQQTSQKLSMGAPTFVPGSMEWGAAVDACTSSVPSKKIRERAGSLSHASTDSGLSSDEASCGYDSEADLQAVCV